MVPALDEHGHVGDDADLAGLVAGEDAAPLRARKIAMDQRRGNAGRVEGLGDMGGMRDGRGMGLMFRGLDLTDAQKDQIKSIMTTSREGNKSLRDQMHSIREQINAATEGGNFDENSIRQLAEQQGALHAKMVIERERVKSQVFNVLTPDQKAKAAEMKAQFKQKMQVRRKNRSKKADPQ